MYIIVAQGGSGKHNGYNSKKKFGLWFHEVLFKDTYSINGIYLGVYQCIETIRVTLNKYTYALHVDNSKVNEEMKYLDAKLLDNFFWATQHRKTHFDIRITKFNLDQEEDIRWPWMWPQNRKTLRKRTGDWSAWLLAHNWMNRLEVRALRPTKVRASARSSDVLHHTRYYELLLPAWTTNWMSRRWHKPVCVCGSRVNRWRGNSDHVYYTRGPSDPG